MRIYSICVCICMCMYMYVYVYVCVCVYVYSICMYLYVCVCMCMYVYIVCVCYQVVQQVYGHGVVGLLAEYVCIMGVEGYRRGLEGYIHIIKEGYRVIGL
jgi:hypothetical protein